MGKRVTNEELMDKLEHIDYKLDTSGYLAYFSIGAAFSIAGIFFFYADQSRSSLILAWIGIAMMIFAGLRSLYNHNKRKNK